MFPAKSTRLAILCQLSFAPLAPKESSALKDRARAPQPHAPRDKSRHHLRNALPANPTLSAAATRPTFARRVLLANSAATAQVRNASLGPYLSPSMWIPLIYSKLHAPCFARCSRVLAGQAPLDNRVRNVPKYLRRRLPSQVQDSFWPILLRER